MTRNCDACGKEFEAKRSTAKYCGGTCRQRGNRRPNGVVPMPAPDESGLVGSIRAELERVGRLDTPLGQQAMALAERIGSPFDTGSAMAALSRELRAVMVEAMAGANVAASALDELRARRDRKRTG